MRDNIEKSAMKKTLITFLYAVVIITAIGIAVNLNKCFAERFGNIFVFTFNDNEGKSVNTSFLRIKNRFQQPLSLCFLSSCKDDQICTLKRIAPLAKAGEKLQIETVGYFVQLKCIVQYHITLIKITIAVVHFYKFVKIRHFFLIFNELHVLHCSFHSILFRFCSPRKF
jgi:hypothetical protein